MTLRQTLEAKMDISTHKHGAWRATDSLFNFRDRQKQKSFRTK